MTGFYGEFLAELEALDDFLARRRRSIRLVQPEDPDVRRLMESLAFFSARTRETANEQLRESVQRLVHGHLDDFMTPQPTRGMLCATPGARLVDPVRLPRGSRVRLRTMDDDVGMFTTMRDVTIRPLTLDWAELQMRGRRGFRILLRIQSRTLCRGIAEPLSLHIDHLDDYLASLRMFTSLRQHLDKAWVVYDDVPAPGDRVEQDERYQECDVGFGGSPAADELLDITNRLYRAPSGTVANIRDFFHFPQKELYLDLGLPDAARPWRQAWICLELDDKWPTELVVGESLFRLFMVPIENLFVEPAEPIKADGTQTAHPIAPGVSAIQASFHSVVEVSQQTATGPDVILPAYLAGGRDSYDVGYRGDDVDPTLLLRMPDAFAHPRMVMVQARWHQPWFDDVAVGTLEASLQTRHIEGVEFHIQGELTPHRRSPLWHDPTAMLQVLSLRSKRILSRQDIVKLMTTLGADDSSHHGSVASELLHVEVREEPADRRRGGGVAYVYRMVLAAVEEDEQGLQDDYVRRVGELLDGWSSNPIRMEIRRRAARDRASGGEAGAG
ncbi:MAG: type VI secretion system baseplate subunit TssF [Myxococcota bacterium]